MMELNLTEEEENAISEEARDRKFRIRTDKYIYAIDSAEEVKTFIDAYKFLDILADNLRRKEKTEAVAAKIRNYLQQFDNIYKILIDLYCEYDDGLETGKYYYKEKMRECLAKEKEKIKTLINDVYPIGRKISKYDPSDSSGLY